MYSVALQIMDDAGPEHLAETLGPNNTAQLLIDTLKLGKVLPAAARMH